MLKPALPTLVSFPSLTASIIVSKATFSKTTHQRCIVHIIRNLTKCVSKKEWKALCNDLKEIYNEEISNSVLSSIFSTNDYFSIIGLTNDDVKAIS